MRHFMKKRILLIGTHEVLMDRLVGLLEQAGFEALPAMDVDRSVELLEKEPLDVIVIGGGVPPSNRSKIDTAAEEHKPGVPVVEHFGAPTTLVGEVKAALGVEDG
jgi:hypothetical protein